MESPDSKNLNTFEQKNLRWQEILQQIEKIGEEYGQEIDPGIKETVAALNSNKFTTSASCEGHINQDAHLPYPWVHISSELEQKTINSPRYIELSTGNAKEIDEGKQVLTDEEKKECRALIADIRRSTDEEIKRLLGLLDEFYATKGNTGVRLSVSSRQLLMPEKEFGIQPGPHDKNTLERYQQEMKRFTEFLKEKFFA